VDGGRRGEERRGAVSRQCVGTTLSSLALVIPHHTSSVDVI
jgi:hypothetical protein